MYKVRVGKVKLQKKPSRKRPKHSARNLSLPTKTLTISDSPKEGEHNIEGLGP